MAETASLPEILEAGVSRNLRGLHTACVGVFTAYSGSSYMATVQPQALDGVVPEPVPDVPVALPGAWEAGDPCLLVASEEQFDGALKSTGNARRHGLYYVAVPLVARSGQSTDFVALKGLTETALTDLFNGVIDSITEPTDLTALPVVGAAFGSLLTNLQAAKLIFTAGLQVGSTKLRAR